MFHFLVLRPSFKYCVGEAGILLQRSSQLLVLTGLFVTIQEIAILLQFHGSEIQ